MNLIENKIVPANDFTAESALEILRELCGGKITAAPAFSMLAYTFLRNEIPRKESGNVDWPAVYDLWDATVDYTPGKKELPTWEEYLKMRFHDSQLKSHADKVQELLDAWAVNQSIQKYRFVCTDGEVDGAKFVVVTIIS